MKRLAVGALAAVMAMAPSCARHRLRAADPAVGVELPRDHAAHADAQTEWWHFHGHVTSDDGKRYDWFIAFVRQHTDLDRVAWLPVRWFVDPFQVAYFAVTERANGRFHVREKHAYPDTWAADASHTRLALRHDSWSARALADGSIALSARTRRAALELQLRAAKPAALLGRRGYLHVPPRSSHYYYSLPRMRSTGTLAIDGVRHRVRGDAWLKHEWGFLYTDRLEGWVWFGVQLSSGQELEIGLIFDRDWNLAEGAFAVVEERDGTVTPIALRELGVAETGATWRSPRTDTVYPTGWRLHIADRGVLELTAVADAQEMIVFPANMWAGALSVTGTFDDREVTGDCFAEVVGLDQPFGRSLLRSGKP